MRRREFDSATVTGFQKAPSMRRYLASLSFLFAAAGAAAAMARTWTDSTGRYTLDADLIAFSDTTVVVQRADHELVAVPIEQLSAKDRDFLTSPQGGQLAQSASGGEQIWNLRDGTKLVGRIVDYTSRDITIQRRRGRIYVNDRVFDNLPEFYQQLLPQVVAQTEQLQRTDRRALEAWLVRQRGEPRTFHVNGVVLEMQNGDEYSVPFNLFSDADLKLLRPGWSEWLSAQKTNDYRMQDDKAFLLRSLAAARQRDREVHREIALMQLKLQAVAAGVTALWEVTLYPIAGHSRPPLWVVVPGRDSRQATAAALEQNPGYVAGPVRRVAG